MSAASLKPGQGTPFDLSYPTNPGDSMSNGHRIATFDELLHGGGVDAPVCRCGATATMRLTMTATKPNPHGQGRGKQPTKVATHNGKLCEPCAVELFAAFREVTR